MLYERLLTDAESNGCDSPLEVIMTTVETPLLQLTAKDLMSRNVVVIQHGRAGGGRTDGRPPDG
jgi:hypothetical protein